MKIQQKQNKILRQYFKCFNFKHLKGYKPDLSEVLL